VRIVGDGRLAQPCGTLGFSRPEKESRHSAVTYECPDGTWEIHIFAPGDLHTQLCIVAHELGHVLGLADDWNHGTGVMNPEHCAQVVQVSDKDSAAIVERYK
jgi:hypothetical protein